MSARGKALVLIVLVLGTWAGALPSYQTMSDKGVGVVDYQLAGTTTQTTEYNLMLGSDGLDANRTSLYWDIPFAVLFGLLFAVLALAVADRAVRAGRPVLARRGRIVAVLGVLAGASDLVENLTLLRVVDGHTDQPWPGIAFGFASLKWVLIAVTLVYLLSGWLMTRQASKATASV